MFGSNRHSTDVDIHQVFMSYCYDTKQKQYNGIEC